MRKLLLFTVGFAGSIGFCAYWNPENLLLPLIIAAALGILLGLLTQEMNALELICFGCALGLFWFGVYRHGYLHKIVGLDGEECACTVTIRDYSYATDYGVAADGVVKLGEKPYWIRVYVNEETQLHPGDTVAGTFRLRYTPGGAEEATYHAGKGIFLLGYQRGNVRIIKGFGQEGKYLAAELAEAIKARLRELFPGDVFPFTQALLLGDSAELSYELNTAFKLSGIRHIIAVSGLHVAILYSLLSTVAFKNKYLTALLCLPSLALFAAVAGFTPSVVRACIMVGLMILAQLFKREYDPPTSLAFAVLVMLAVNPLVITSVSFQLSVGCVAGIQLFSKPIGEWLAERLGGTKGKGLLPVCKRWFVSSVSVSLGAMSLTTPLSAYYFGAVSLVGILTNLLTLWVVNLIFNGLIFVCLLSLLSIPAASVLAAVLAWPIRFVLGCAVFLGGLPLAAVYTVSPYITAWLAFVYLLLLVFLWGCRKPGVLCCCAVIGLCIALLASWAEPMLDSVRVTMLDVGQGQSILLQSGGKTFLVDCGGDSDTETADLIAETVLSMGISHLDGILLTHDDRDHAGALENLLTRLDTQCLILPSTVKSCPEADCETIYVRHDLSISYEDTTIQIFAPNYGQNGNENSLCVLFTAENCDILITGDRSSLGELALITDHDLPQVELLVAGHHGSKHATSEALLEAVRPEVVFISAGEDNRYGHPAQETLERLARFGCRVYRTDLYGTLIFRR